VPRIKSDERWALELLENKGVYLYPGYFFDFESEGYLVVSLLPLEETFQSGVRSLVGWMGR
jgi:aspartate/methionine/tyrosine aminotransferase